MNRRIAAALLCGVLSLSNTVSASTATATAPASQAPPADVPENVYRGELISFPGPWGFQIGHQGMILVSDEQLEQLADPDRKVNISLGPTPNEVSLRQICERAKAARQRKLAIAFDQFFLQYRPGQGDKPRQLTPDKPEYVSLIAKISKFAQQYGLGLELSLLTPLEIGPAYAQETGEHGVWMHYRKGLRDPRSGAYSVQLWRQTKWANNKGTIRLKDAGVRVFAFREQRLHRTPYLYVDPKSIVEITSTAKVEVWPENDVRSLSRRINVHGTGVADAAGLNRVLVVQMYDTPEMDYFSEKAPGYLRQLVDRYADAGVKLSGLYSDEMHIQQDWFYGGRQEHGQFAMRYVSPGLARQFAALYGKQYEDFARWLIYFTYGQNDYVSDLTASEKTMHVFGTSPQDIRATALLRSRYYKLLQDGVVDLFVGAKKHLEARMGYRMDARAHATWAESPTCDFWTPGQGKYEYTPGFIWSNTVHQAAAACHDYFKWGDFLTGNGNDTAEGGFIDQNYYALSLAASTGILNDVPNSYAAAWGSPHPILVQRHALSNASGAAAMPPFALVQDYQHRDVQVLMLYPIDLVAAEERFGSWMSQYGYANYVTQDKLLERGTIVNGAIEMAGRRFTTLVAEFEPFPTQRLLDIMRQLTEQGGRAIWSGPPPIIDRDAKPVLDNWQTLFGVNYTPGVAEGLGVPGKLVHFEGALSNVSPMTILTDFMVDHIYPLTPAGDTSVLARVKDQIVGTMRKLPGGGQRVVLGFRPRDDQSGSLGYDERHWFEILNTLGAYPPTGRFAGVNDNTEFVSRGTGYLACRFPNGTVAIAPHLRGLEENWPGGFARDAKKDQEAMARTKLPSSRIDLADFKVNGHSVTFSGNHTLAFRADESGVPIALCSCDANQITIDGRTTVFSDKPLPLVAWAPVEQSRRVEHGAIMQIVVHGAAKVSIPVPNLTGPIDLIAEGGTPGSRGAAVPSSMENGVLSFSGGGNLYIVPRPLKMAAAHP